MGPGSHKEPSMQRSTIRMLAEMQMKESEVVVDEKTTEVEKELLLQ